ncbi:hypothetical protein EDP1_4199 [Pseudomonas putida S610]|nr:hypothetical protein EDP1_4199 [Pseudomonas putida S610]
MVTSTWSARTWLVGNLSADRRFIQSELFKLANISASDGRDSFNYRIVSADIVIVWRGYSDRTSGAVCRDSDDSLAIVQGESQRAVFVDWQAVFVGQRHGISDLTAFGDRVGCGELGDNFVDGVSDFHRCIVAQLQVFEGTAASICCRFDTQADFA